jgi:hypothetical protein
MQMNGRYQISATKCVSTVIATPGVVGATNTYSTGDTTLATAAAPAAATLTFATNGGAGFAAGNQTIIVGYGRDSSEEVTASVSGVTATILAGTPLRNNHPIGDRVVVKRAAIRPGSVLIGSNVAGVGGIDDGNGNIVVATASNYSGTVATTTATGTVDYATGVVKATYSTTASTQSFTVDTIPDAPDINDRNGSGFFKNFLIHNFTQQGAPTSITVSNLGQGEVGVFVEVSRNNGRTFTAGRGVTLRGLARAVLPCPVVNGSIHEVVRVRAGLKSSWSSSAQSAEFKRQVWDGVVDVDTVSITNMNGGSV